MAAPALIGKWVLVGKEGHHGVVAAEWRWNLESKAALTTHGGLQDLLGFGVWYRRTHMHDLDSMGWVSGLDLERMTPLIDVGAY